MANLTLQAASQRIAKMLNICATDPRVAEYLNAAVQRLLPKGKWVGTLARYQVCTASACLTWPREIETIESWSVNKCPGVVRDFWYERNPNGPGMQTSLSFDGTALIDRVGQFVAFDDVHGANQRLIVYCDNALDAGKTILLNYYDTNGNKVIALNGNEWGDRITLVAPPAYASARFNVMPSGLYGVQKDVTLGVVRLYSFDMVALTQYPLGYYEPDEVLPAYRRSFVPGLPNVPTSSTCSTPIVDIIGKLAFVPVKNQSDYLMIGCLPALEAEVRAVLAEEQGDLKTALTEEALAVKRLEDELASYTGDGVVMVPRFECPATFGAGGLAVQSSWPG